MGLFAYFSPAPAELLIVGLMCLGIFGGIVVLAAVLSVRKSPRPPPNPNLYPCPDCGRHVSHLAPTCPQCGRPLAPKGPPQADAG
jgi:hypothetical protein